MKRLRITFFFYLFILILPNIALCFTEHLTTAEYISLILFPLSVYWLLLTSVRKMSAVYLYLFPLLFLGAFQIVLLYIFGAGCISVDMWLNLVTTNTSEVNKLLSQLLPSIVAVIIIYVPSLIYASIAVYRKEMLPQSECIKQRKIGGVLLLLSICSLGISSTDEDFHIEHSVFPLNALYNCKLAINRQITTNHYVEKVAPFQFGATDNEQNDSSKIVVLVIGETSRACNWSLNGYQRNTNPLLSKEPRLLVYRDCMSQSNTTHKSVPIMLSPASAENYNLLYRTKGVLAAFREAQYYTAFYSNQQPNNSFIDFLGNEAHEKRYTGEDHQVTKYDGVLLSHLDKIIQKKPGNLFVVLHTYGSHFNYSERYPKSFSYFKPDSNCNAKKSNRAELINAYDNSIRYIDYFLSEIISKLKNSKRSAAMLYLSDHGEDIFDDEHASFLHASPKPTYYQLHIPFLIWTSTAFGEKHPLEQQNLSSHRSFAIGSDCVFHTLLGLGGVNTTFRNDSLSLTNRLFYPKKRHYINDHNEPMGFDKCFDALDRKMIKQHKLRNE
ncbi:MAG: phosphoethanolamine transferase [Bacteroidaceae bacterium]